MHSYWGARSCSCLETVVGKVLVLLEIRMPKSWSCLETLVGKVLVLLETLMQKSWSCPETLKKVLLTSVICDTFGVAAVAALHAHSTMVECIPQLLLWGIACGDRVDQGVTDSEHSITRMNSSMLHPKGNRKVSWAIDEFSWHMCSTLLSDQMRQPLPSLNCNPKSSMVFLVSPSSTSGWSCMVDISSTVLFFFGA